MDAKVETRPATCGVCPHMTVGTLTGFTSCAETGRRVTVATIPRRQWCPLRHADREGA